MKINGRDISLDLIRVIACVMVVAMHSPMPTEHASGPFLCALSYFCAPCIGLFFMVSGALLIPIKNDYFTFLRKRFGKIIIPTIVWSVIYILLKIYNSESQINIARTFASIPFSAQGNGVLWFMYTLAGLYLLAPILSAWLEKVQKREIQLILLLWTLTLCYPILEFWISVNTSNTGILYYFTGYSGYFLLGYYMKRYPRSISIITLLIISTLGVMLLGLLNYYDVNFDFYRLFWYLSIFVASLCCVIWKGVLWLCMKPKIIKLLRSCFSILCISSNLTFGVYLIHILIMRDFLWRCEWVLHIKNYPLQCGIITTVTLILSFVMYLLISRIPKSEWIIGYNSLYPKF